jgi:DNA-binding CsgD family transcriptional regulator
MASLSNACRRCGAVAGERCWDLRAGAGDELRPRARSHAERSDEQATAGVTRFPDYYRPRYGRGPCSTDQPCVKCGAKETERCWNLLTAVRTKHTARPHPERLTPIPGYAAAPREIEWSPDGIRNQTRLWVNRAGAGRLSPVHCQVVMMIAEGLTDQAIGRALGRTTHSAKTLVRDVMKELAASCRANIVHRAYQVRILTVADQEEGGTCG